MVLVSPGFSVTFSKPRSCFTGRLIDAVTSCTYIWITVAPSRLPVLVTSTLAVTLPSRFRVGADIFTSETLKVV